MMKYWRYYLSAGVLMVLGVVWSIYGSFKPNDSILSSHPPTQQNEKISVEFLHLTSPITLEQQQETQEILPSVFPDKISRMMITQAFEGLDFVFDRRIVKMFAEQYHIQATFKGFSDIASINRYLLTHPLSIAIGMPISDDARFVSVHPYRTNHLVLIGDSKTPVPKSLTRIASLFSSRTNLSLQPSLSVPSQVHIAVFENNPHIDLINQVMQSYPRYALASLSPTTINHLVSTLLNKTFDYAIVNEHDWLAIKSIYLSLDAKLIFNQALPITWQTSSKISTDWIKKIDHFFVNLRNNGKLLSLVEKTQFDFNRLNHLDIHYFHKRINTRLRPLIPYFKKAAVVQNLPWTLLAALSYQESQWISKAVSSTGARGLMMINALTAKQLAMPFNADEEQQILYGARYFKMLYDSLSYISENDRLFFALVAYNSGPSALSSLIRELAANKNLSYHLDPKDQQIEKHYRSKGLISARLPLSIWQKMNWISLRQHILQKSSKGRYSSQSVILTERVRIFYTLLKYLDQVGRFKKIPPAGN